MRIMVGFRNMQCEGNDYRRLNLGKDAERTRPRKAPALVIYELIHIGLVYFSARLRPASIAPQSDSIVPGTAIQVPRKGSLTFYHGVFGKAVPPKRSECEDASMFSAPKRGRLLKRGSGASANKSALRCAIFPVLR